MNEMNKSKAQLVSELASMRSRINELEQIADEHNQAIQQLNQEIAERQLAEEVLRDSEAKYQGCFDNAPNGIFVVDETGRYLEANQAACQITGYSKHELLQLSVPDILPPESRADGAQHFQQMISQGHASGELAFLRQDGSEGYWSVEVTRLSENRFIGFVRDITDRVLAEQLVIERDARLQSFFDNAAIGIAIANPQGRYIQVNQHYLDMFGFDNEEELFQNSVGELTHPEDRATTRQAQRDLAAGKIRFFKDEKRYLRKDGSYFWGEVSVAPIKGSDSSINTFTAIITDITERKLSVQALQESEARNKTILNALPDLMFRLSRNGKHLDFHAPSLDQLYVSPETFLGKHVGQVLPTEVAAQYLQHIEACLDNGQLRIFEYRLNFGDQGVKEYEARMLASGQDEVLAVVRDITKRKQAEADLQESEERFRQLAENIQEVFWLNNLDQTETLYISPAYEQIWGRTCESLYQKPDTWLAAVHPDDHARLRKNYKKHIAGEPTSTQYRIIRPDGSLRWIQDHAFPICDEQGVTYRIAGIATDVTERKRIENALRESEERYRALVEFSPVAISVFQNGKYLFTNPAGAKMLGYSEPAQVVGLDAMETVAPDYRPLVQQRMHQLDAGQSNLPIELELLRADGSTLLIESISVPIELEGKPASLVIGQDVSAGLQAEQALRDSLQTAADIVEAIPAGLFIYQFEPPDQLFLLDGNPEAQRTTGLDIQASIGKEFNEIWPEARDSGVTESFLQPMWTGKTYETEDLHYSDERLTGAFRVRAFQLPGQRLAVSFDNITERLQAEAAEREQRTLATALLETAEVINRTLDLDEVLERVLSVVKNVVPHDGANIMLLEADNTALRVVQYCACYHQRGLDNPELGQLWQLDDFSHLQQMLDTGLPLLIKDTQGHPSWSKSQITNPICSYLGAPICLDDQVIGLLNLDSVTPDFFNEQHLAHLQAVTNHVAIAIQNARLHENVQRQLVQLRETQTRLVQSEKLAAIGELVAGVAHELNNPLTSVTLYAQLLPHVQEENKIKEYIQQIVEQAQRATSIVSGLLDFARQRPSQRVPVQINDTLNSTVSLLAYELRTRNVQGQMKLDPDLPLIVVDPHQLQQVFVNIINNALQAMSGQTDSELWISTAVGPSQFLGQQADASPMVRIAFADNGPGIPIELQSRIFDPFFTTKDVGEGTGLGLAVCHGIISEHDGYIWVESQEGDGATFFIELPIESTVEKSTAAHPDQEDQAEQAAGTRTARILVVDDEEPILNAVSLSLKDYQVDQARNGEVALEKVAVAAYDLILCDLHMPGMSGIDFYRQLQIEHPHLLGRILFMTGDAISPLAKEFLQEISAQKLSKPFDIATLITIVDETLQQKGSKPLLD